jgi:hypothetical protein
VQVEAVEVCGHASEFARIVAEEIHAGNAQRADGGDGGGLDLIRKQIAEKKTDGLPRVFDAEEVYCACPCVAEPACARRGGQRG